LALVSNQQKPENGYQDDDAGNYQQSAFVTFRFFFQLVTLQSGAINELELITAQSSRIKWSFRFLTFGNTRAKFSTHHLKSTYYQFVKKSALIAAQFVLPGRPMVSSIDYENSL
jgi:hypothetical protein